MYYWDRRWKLPLEATPNNFDGEKWHVPVDDRSNSWLTILPEDKYRVTQIYFPANPTVTDLQDNILEGATNLRLVDFTSLNTITSIVSNCLLSCSILNFVVVGNLVNVTTVNKSFLTGCDNLKQLNVFNKDPNTFTTDPEGFMDTVSGDCIIRANNLVNEYKDVDPWKSRADHIYE